MPGGVSDIVSIGLQRVVDGSWLDVGDPDQVHAAGTVLADLHAGLAEYPGEQTDPEPLRERIDPWPDGLPGEADLPAQLVHNDYRAANILCAQDKVVAVLDFEDLKYDYRGADVAHAMVLLGTRFRNWGPTAPETQERFLAGYQSICPLSPAESARLPTLVSDGEAKLGWSSVGANG